MKKGNLNRKKIWISQRLSVSYSPFLSTISFPVSTGDKIWGTSACRPGQFKRDVLPLEMVNIVFLAASLVTPPEILHGTTGIVPSISSSPIPIPPSLFSIQCCLANDCNNQSVAPRLSPTVVPSASTTLTIKLILTLHRNTCLCILCPDGVFILKSRFRK